MSTIDTVPLPAPRHTTWWARAAVAVTLAGGVATPALSWSARSHPGLGNLPFDTVDATLTILAFGLAGALLIDRRPDLPFGWLLAAGAVLHTVHACATLGGVTAAMNGHQGQAVRWLIVAGSGLGPMPMVVYGLVNLRFPGGRVGGRPGR